MPHTAPGGLAAVDPDRRHPVEAAVLDAVGTRGHRSVDTILRRLADERLTGLGRSLAAAGSVGRRIPGGRGAWRPTRAGPESPRRLRDVRRLSDDPAVAAHQTCTAFGGAAALSCLEGGAGDGGGF